MNQIKFCLYDPDTKELIGYEAIANDKWIFIPMPEIKNGAKFFFGVYGSKEAIREQSTGALDQDAKQIYNHDIVEGYTGLKGYVFWNEGDNQWWLYPYDGLPHPLRDHNQDVKVVGHEFNGER